MKKRMEKNLIMLGSMYVLVTILFVIYYMKRSA